MDEIEEIKDIIEENVEADPKLYEIGYLLTPLIPVDKLADEVNLVRSAIEKEKGLITDEETPKNRQLAYEIKKFNMAYFGWIKFMARPDAIEGLKKNLEENGNILRFLILSAMQEIAFQKPAREPKLKNIEKQSADLPHKEKIKEEEIDRKLEEIAGI